MDSSNARDAERLASRLAAALDIDAACDAVADHLAATGMSLPSLYLERGGRLRCQAQRGYWQVQDGFPVGTGVLGSTYARGVPTWVRPDEAVEYIEAAPDVADELCVPVRCDERVVGALNVESSRPLPSDALVRLEEAAELLGRRLAELGGRLPESQEQRLLRHTIALAALTDPDDIRRHVLEAARELAGMQSAMVVLFDEHGQARIRAQAGPLADLSRVVATEDLASIASWVVSGTSCYTVGDPSGVGFAGHEFLRSAGVASVIAVPLVARGLRLGLLLLADSTPRRPSTALVERLELLAAQTATSLVTASVLAELQERAACDPLTGLGHQASFRSALAVAAGGLRHGRRLAVLVVDLDGFKRINDRLGHLAGDRVLVEVAVALTGSLRDGDVLYRIGGDEFATAIAVRDDSEALEVGRRLCRATAETGHTTVSVGVAVAADGEAPEAVLHRADEALYLAKDAGRDAVYLAEPSPRALRSGRAAGSPVPAP